MYESDLNTATKVEPSLEWNSSLYITFFYYEKAFDSITSIEINTIHYRN